MVGQLQKIKSIKGALKAIKEGMLWVEISNKETHNKEIVTPQNALKYFENYKKNKHETTIPIF